MSDTIFKINGSSLNNLTISEFQTNKKSNDSFYFKKNPFTQEDLYQIFPIHSLQVARIIQNSQKFFLEYKSSHLSDRLDLLNKIKNYIELNKNKISELEALDQGLPLKFTLENSIELTLNYLNQLNSELRSRIEDENYINPMPVGVVVAVVSWNLSFRLVAQRVFAALAAGNTIIVKISSYSPSTLLIFKEMIEVCHLPEHLIQIIITKDNYALELLLTHPGVKAISFVGQLKTSFDVIKMITQNNQNGFKKINIASGTKNSAIVLDELSDTDFESLMQSFLIGQGQLAWNSTRLFVLEKNENYYLQKIQEYLSLQRPSESIYDSSCWTPILKSESIQNYTTSLAQLRADQGKIINTPFKLEGLNSQSFLPICFSQDLSKCSTLQQDQLGAPLFILTSVKYAFDIPKYSNVSYFGYAAHIWGEEAKMKKLSSDLEVGLVCKNNWSVQKYESFPAMKQSSYGYTDLNAFGSFFTNPKIID